MLVRKKNEGKWAKVREQKFESEAVLQNILYDSLDIIPIEKLGRNSQSQDCISELKCLSILTLS